MDVLSEVLKAVKLDGAVFFNGEFSSPWCAWEPDAGTMASYLAAGAGHIIIFHLILEGRAYARVEEDGSAVPLVAGDIVAETATAVWFLTELEFSTDLSMPDDPTP